MHINHYVYHFDNNGLSVCCTADSCFSTPPAKPPATPPEKKKIKSLCYITLNS